jgi:hypothetical protein
MTGTAGRVGVVLLLAAGLLLIWSSAHGASVSGTARDWLAARLPAPAGWPTGVPVPPREAETYQPAQIGGG